MDLVFQAVHHFARIAPRKARYVIDLIRERPVNEALRLLQFTPRRAARFIDKVLRSALANAGDTANRQKLNIDADKLFVKECYVDGAPMFKRFRARSRGMANPIHKRNSHITIKLAPMAGVDVTPKPKKSKEKPAAPAAPAAATAPAPAAAAPAPEKKP